jgi:hypothetical protein
MTANATPNLNLPYYVAGQLQPDVPINASLDIIDSLAGTIAAFGWDQSSSSLLTYGYYGGNLLNGGSVSAIAAGTLTLPASSTSYVEMTPAGVVSSNTTGFTSGLIPLATVLTNSTAIQSVIDNRPSAVSSGGSASPITTEGDLVVGSAAGTPVRLPLGSPGQVLTVGGAGEPAWEAPGGSGETVLLADGTPRVIAESITITNASGAFTLGQAIYGPVPAGTVLVYMPANAVVGDSTGGVYPCTMSSASAGQLANSPATTAGTYTLWSSGGVDVYPWTVSVPAGAMGTGGVLEVETAVSVAGTSAWFDWEFGGTKLASALSNSMSPGYEYRATARVANRASSAAQATTVRTTQVASGGGTSTYGAQAASSTVDTSAAQTVAVGTGFSGTGTTTVHQYLIIKVLKA